MGLKNIKNISKKYKKCEIYFHMDLDGVTSALAMKYYLETYYNINMIDCHIIQYGGLEFAVNEIKDDNLAIVVDFSHSKPMFQIATDHHDSQIGDEQTNSTYFKSARSNVEIISNEISHNDIFISTDIELIRTIDSANFLEYNIKPENIQNSIFKNDKKLSTNQNRYMMGFVVNRLLLAYKNKRITVRSLDGKNNHKNRNILECLTMDSTASLYSMYNNLKHYINNAKTSDRLGRLSTPEEILKNVTSYINRMKNYSFVEDSEGQTYEISTNELKVLKIINNKIKRDLPKISKNLGISFKDLKECIANLQENKYIFFTRNNNYFVGDKGKKLLEFKKVTKGVHMDKEYKIIIQYGGGNMFEPGSYDRYTPFKNFPKANFLCIVWPMGIIQISCNPFREKELKDVDLGSIAREVLSEHKNKLSNIFISLESLKNEYETSQNWKKMQKEEGDDFSGVGFKFSDLKAFYSDNIIDINNNKIDMNNINIESIMNIDYEFLSEEQKNKLKLYRVSIFDIIQRNSGGHPSITNLSGIGFLKYDKDNLKKYYNTEKYTDVMKLLARELVNNLKGKIDKVKAGENFEYKNVDVKLTGTDTNE